MIDWSDAITAGRNVGVLFAVLSGIAFWWDRYRSRPRLIVHSFEEPKRWGESASVTFEIENVGTGLTSLLPVINASALSMFGDEVSATLRIRDGQCRTLEPHTPVRVDALIEPRATSASSMDDDPLGLTSFRVFHIGTTRGRAGVYRVRSTACSPLRGFFTYRWERRKAKRAAQARWRAVQGVGA